MSDQTIEKETRMYLYDLMNAAKEHGFKADDSWELSMVTDIERSRIQRNYYPTIATKIIPEILQQVFNATKVQLHQSYNKEDQPTDARGVLKGELNYLVAYNLKRPRT